MYDEKVLVGLDFAIHEASKRGIRVVPVLANYWAMYGGIDQYNIWSFEAGSGEPLSLSLSNQTYSFLSYGQTNSRSAT